MAPPTEATRPPRPALPILLGLLLAAAALAHVLYAYWPRERPAAPSSPLARAVLGDPDLTDALWLPYPHQNLARLARTAGGFDQALAAVAAATGGRAVRLPGLGPFRLVPASEAVLAADAGGRRLLALRVYPVFARVARWSGWLAGNAWLAGGTIDGGSGDPLEVRWQGDLWIASTPGIDLPAEGPPLAAQAALAVARLGSPPAPLPAGLYRCWRHGGELVLTSAGLTSPPPTGVAVVVEQPGLALFQLSRPAPGAPARALAVYDRDGGPIPGLPSFATLARGDDAEAVLPGERLLKRLGVHADHQRVGAWSLAAFDRASIERTAQLAAGLDGALAPAGETLVYGAWLDLDSARRLRRPLRQLLELLPGAERERRALAALHLLLDLAPDAHHLDVEILASPPAVWLALSTRPPAAGSTGRRGD